MLDVCFINPPHPYLVSPTAQAPLGILYLAAVCEHAGRRTAVVNLSGVPPARRLPMIPPAAVYGISGTFLDVAEINALVHQLLARDSSTRVLVGGPVWLSGEMLDDRAIVASGEGESQIIDLVDGRAGVAREMDVDEIPFPARHLWAGPFGGDIFIGRDNYFGGGSATFLTSRGCPMSCAFCAGPALGSRRIRRRSAAAVVEELEQCLTDYGVRQFRFSDEYFTADPRHVDAVCDGICSSSILGHGKGIAWRCSIGVRPHDLSMFTTMAAAGCREVSIGVESADPHVLQLICGAKVTEAHTTACLRACAAAGLKRRVLMMVGTPGSRAATIGHFKRFLDRDRRDQLFEQLALTVFQPIPGSAIATDPDQFGCRLLADPDSLCLFGPGGVADTRPTIEVDGLSAGELHLQVSDMVRLAINHGKLGCG